MTDLFYIDKVAIGKDTLKAEVVVAEGMPLMTSGDIEGTARVYYLAPGIADHMCLGDAGNKFRDCMGDTELAHLLEHLTVEILNQTGLAGKIAYGRTTATDEEGVYEVEVSCPDDILTVGALSSAAFMMSWAYTDPTAAAPDFDGTVKALRNMALNLRPKDDEDGTADAAEGAAAQQADADEVSGQADEALDDAAISDELAEPAAAEAPAAADDDDDYEAAADDAADMNDPYSDEDDE